MDKEVEIMDFLVDWYIATPEEIALVCAINGTNEDALLDILYVRTGCRNLDQFLEEIGGI